MSNTYFSELLPVLAERAKLASISRLGFANVPLRRHLAEVFARPYGEPGSFLADPTFEAVFGWQPAAPSMAELAGSLLSPALVRAMSEPPAELAEYRFGEDQRPYRHQLEAWNILAQPIPQSLVVASGTGSGKTECFMVPILDQLARLRDEKQGRLIGVRALFLYPLNALINSQRDRLRAWTESFGGDVRFCLYNGNTPERPEPARMQREHPSEVLDRENLRASPPPILVTNATMLEYMLVRTADAPILEKSQGKLEWVVLDEAHTYVGSQAAEAALLIRRVLFAFGVTPEQVRFVATSATIGDPEGEAGQKLKRFLAEVAGVSEDRVHLVSGHRKVPSLDGAKPKSRASLSELSAIEPEKETSPHRYDALVENVTARKLRDLFIRDANKPVARLSEICSALIGPDKEYSPEDQQQALRWLDLMTGTRDNTGKGPNDGNSFLPLRAHLFHQTLSGLWACADSSCSMKHGSLLADEQWPFGMVYLEPRKHCDCGSPAYEVVACGDCGTVHLLAGIAKKRLTHLQALGALDEFELEAEPDEEVTETSDAEEDIPGGLQNKVLIVNRKLTHVDAFTLDRTTRQLTEPDEKSLTILVHEEDSDGLLCPVCSSSESLRERLFQSSRIGAPFLLGSILPTLLEYAPDGIKPADHPCRGRRLLTFNDSRQGTARMAAKLQQDAERNRVRGLVYHLSLQQGRGQASAQAEDLGNEIKTLEQIPVSARNPALEKLIAGKHAELANLSRPVPIPFNDLAQQLAGQGRDFDNMLDHYRRYAPGTFSEASGALELARMFLVREFGRRPKRLNNLESMGLVAVQYPALDAVREVPQTVVQTASFDLATWRDFLKLSLDFYVRAGGSLAITPTWRNWLGMPFPQTQLVQRDEKTVGRTQRRWPRSKRGGLKSTLVRLLAYVLKADIASTHSEDRIDTILLAAWDELCRVGLLQQVGDGRVLPLDRLAFAPIDHAWICPVTRRFLDTTLRGISPYLPKNAPPDAAPCQRVDLPLFDEPFAGVTDDLERIRLGRNWLSNHADIADLREQGLWPVLNDRVIELAPYFTAAEHSAQQASKTLDLYEKAFKAGDLNLLSCSTTMEMGIDIGGISLVAMNNVPPHPANYLQRAGRAGRRGETRSLAMTLCKSNPHDQAVFDNSRWAFDAALPAPRVSLDSPIIVQRHVQSLLLSRFLAQTLASGGQEQIKLTCGLFFLGEMPLANRYAAWCRGFDADHSEELARGLRQLLRHSVFDGMELNRMTDRAAETMDELFTGWMVEWGHLINEENDIRLAGENSPAFRAVSLHKARLSGEYLLRELATRGYLPAYGFPTHIASFDNLTYGQFQRARRDAEGREDNRFRKRELASRDLMTALREYAPGSEVVMDGLVYRSAGVTLNWHIPAAQQDAHEIQDIRLAWRCSHCGASGSSHSLGAARHCDACGTDIAPSNIREFLEPAGFAVDFYKEPGNDISTQHFVPVEAPWINARGNWFALPNPALGRFRTTSEGHLFHQSRGIHGAGYALCLDCGRAEPMLPDGGLPDVFQKPHRKLRRAREDGLFCPGSDNAWKIKQGLTLGHETRTDVLELQIKTEAGVWLNDPIAAMTLAVALRDALAELIGVQATELGCTTKESRQEDRTRCHSILIFDRFAAGYASSAERHLGTLFHLARNRLKCPANCDSACPHCVLDFDQRFAADSLDRYAALEILSEAWLNNLRLPEELAFFGPASRPDYQRLQEAVWQVVTRQDCPGVRLYAGGTSQQSWDVGPSPLRLLAYRLAGQGVNVEIVLSGNSLGTLDETDRYLLASLADHPRISIRTTTSSVRAGHGWLFAETTGIPARRWAVGSDAALVFAGNWGKTGEPLVMVDAEELPALHGELLTSVIIRPQKIDIGDREIEVHHQLDGPIQGFGQRFWQHISVSHPATHSLLDDQVCDITTIVYRDRYLFTPLSIALLAEIVNGLRQLVGRGRWADPVMEIVTMNRRGSGENYAKNTVWADWQNLDLRDQTFIETFNHLGIEATIQLADSSETGHGRLMEINFSSGKKLTIRLDQGVSYWRAAHTNSRQNCSFNLLDDDALLQGKRLAELTVNIEGALLPTQVFIKVR